MAAEQQELIQNAIIFAREGCLEESEKAFSQVRDNDPDNPDCSANLGVILRQPGKTDAALASYQHAFSIDSKHSGALYNCANILRDGRRHQEAIGYYHQAQKIQPDQPYLFDNIGNAYLEIKNLPYAKASYRQVLDIDPNFNPTLAHIGITYFKDDKPDDAIK